MQSVATPIESKVNGVDKLLYLQSVNANDGKMTLNVTFDVGTDVGHRLSESVTQVKAGTRDEGG